MTISNNFKDTIQNFDDDLIEYDPDYIKDKDEKLFKRPD